MPSPHRMRAGFVFGPFPKVGFHSRAASGVRNNWESAVLPPPPPPPPPKSGEAEMEEDSALISFRSLSLGCCPLAVFGYLLDVTVFSIKDH